MDAYIELAAFDADDGEPVDEIGIDRSANPPEQCNPRA